METLIYFGGEIKALGGGKVGGYLVRFSTADDPDLTGDYFTKSTDFDLERSAMATVLYDHGLDETLKRRKLGMVECKVDDAGVWAEGQLALRDDYEREIYKLAEAGKLGWSSGTAPHLVERKQVGNAFEVLAWPLGLDASLTPRPAEPRTLAVSLKSYLAEKSANLPDGLVSGLSLTEHSAAVVSACAQRTQEVETLLAGLKAYAARIEDRLKFRTETKAGRMLSAANINKLKETCSMIESLRGGLDGCHGSLSALVSMAEKSNDSDEDDMKKSLEVSGQLYAEFLQLQTRLIAAEV